MWSGWSQATPHRTADHDAESHFITYPHISLRVHSVHTIHSGGGSGSRGGTIIIISSLCHVDSSTTFVRRRRRSRSPFHLYSSVDDYREVKDSEFYRIYLSWCLTLLAKTFWHHELRCAFSLAFFSEQWLCKLGEGVRAVAAAKVWAWLIVITTCRECRECVQFPSTSYQYYHHRPQLPYNYTVKQLPNIVVISNK